jgi:hypothetical protein
MEGLGPSKGCVGGRAERTAGRASLTFDFEAAPVVCHLTVEWLVAGTSHCICNHLCSADGGTGTEQRMLWREG